MDIQSNISNGVYENTMIYDKQNREAYRNEDRRLTLMFEVDLYNEAIAAGLSHSIAYNLVKLAWEDGHSQGLYSVYIHFDDLLTRFTNPLSESSEYMNRFMTLANERKSK